MPSILQTSPLPRMGGEVEAITKRKWQYRDVIVNTGKPKYIYRLEVDGEKQKQQGTRQRTGSRQEGKGPKAQRKGLDLGFPEIRKDRLG